MLATNVESDNSPTLLALLRQRIASDGPLTIADYMEACLGDPEFGYYLTRDPFGRGGDFTTAPEISQIFGELIGLWCAVVWRQMGSPAPVRLVELGPGRGTLMADALRAAKTVPAFFGACDVRLVEISPLLRELQAEQLVPSGSEPHWHDRLDDVPAGPAILFANEFLDALPVRQFLRSDGKWLERHVGLSEAGTLEFQGFPLAEGSKPLIPQALRDMAREGDVVECRPAVARIVEMLAARSRRNPLAALFIDYGRDASAPGETLQAVRGHEYADPLERPGHADLTAHVDFGELRQSAQQHGLRVFGPTRQSEFLLALGLEERCDKLMSNTDEAGRKKIASGARRLVDPAQMGELFRVVAVTSGQVAPPGFTVE